MKKIVDMEKWNEFYNSIANKPLPLEGEKEAQAYVLGLKDASNVMNTWITEQPDAEEKRLYKTKKYTINYGYGGAVLYTPYDFEERFYTLANTCFGIRKSIMCCVILEKEDAEIEDFERLEFGGDIYIWREDGARKMLEPFPDEDWNEDFCEECRYTGEEE